MWYKTIISIIIVNHLIYCIYYGCKIYKLLIFIIHDHRARLFVGVPCIYGSGFDH